MRLMLLGATLVFVVVEIVALFPSSIEEDKTPPPTGAIEPQTLVPQQTGTLATGIPTGIIPEYSIDQFNYVSTIGGEKQWKLLAQKADEFHKQNLVHALAIKAFLYDPDG
jgi:hypothetical protein